MSRISPLSPLPLEAFCILCRDMDNHLAFYTETLGLEIKRREESFIAFDTSGFTLCLWEIAHVAKHLNLPDRPPGVEPIKAGVVLNLPETSYSDLPNRLQRTGVGYRDSSSAVFRVTDHHATDWIVRAHGSTEACVAGIVLYVSDLEASAKFYEKAFGCTVLRQTGGTCRFNGANDAYVELEASSEAADTSHNTMIALGFANSCEIRLALQCLERGGVKFHSPPKLHEWGFDAGYFTDPDGHVWELYATKRDL